ncbi:MAG: PhoH family protein [Candidatus Omnitrophica bacterium]|nr:PhoH family protein [Candidatus Omnitrophota bacterium]
MPPQKKKKKIFVIDTNVILHDSSCIYQFEKCDIVIPISVIEELDNFKKGHDTLNLHAREFLRALDALSSDKIFNGGVPIGPDLGKISIKLDGKYHKDLALSFTNKPDHNILNTAYQLSKKLENQKVVLVTKDVNLRMKARAVGLTAEDYTTDHVKDISQLYKGYRFEENIPLDLIEKIYNDPAGIDAKLLNAQKNLLPNEYIVLRNDNKSALGYLDPADGMIKRVEKISSSGIKPRNVEQTFALHALLNESIKLITISGKAGTGKTLLALAAALERRDHYGQIFLARPIVPLSNKDSGFLPGDIFQKISPYMQPLYDNLGVIQNKRIEESAKKPKKLAKVLDEEKLTIAPLAYIRGRSLVDTYFIVDEAQNLTPHEVKTIITRAGENTKMVFTGDIFQIDHPYLDIYSNGLSYLIEKMQGQKLYTHINLEKGERSELAEIASNLL